MVKIGFPAGYPWLGAGNGDLAFVDFNREDPVPLRKGERHQRRDLGNVDLQRVDAIERLARLGRKPAAEALQIKCLARPGEIVKLLRGDKLEGMQRLRLADSRSP